MESISPQRLSSPPRSDFTEFNEVAARPDPAAIRTLTNEQRVDRLWAELETQRTAQAAPCTYLTDAQVTPNSTGIRCMDNAAVIRVRTGSATDATVPVHAHQLQIDHANPRDAGSPVAHYYAAGQSPEDGFSNMLIQGLDSGQGIYQFVSRKAHRDGSGAGGETLIKSLFDQSKQSGQFKDHGQPQYLGTRYEITGFERIPKYYQDDHLCCELTARDLATDEIRTIRLTQAGLPFTNKVLQPREIRRASALLQQHRDSLEPPPARPDTETSAGPLIISQAGIGRNAVLIAYRDICKRMEETPSFDETMLDAALKEVILRGRATRGPKFLHSRDQLAALRTALLDALRGTQAVTDLAEQRERQQEKQREGQREGQRFASRQRVATRDVGTSPIRAIEARIPASAGTQELMATSQDDLTELQVQGIVADENMRSCDRTFQTAVLKLTREVADNPVETPPSFQRVASANPRAAPKYALGMPWRSKYTVLPGTALQRQRFSPKMLWSNYKNALAAAEQKQLHSIAFSDSLIEVAPENSRQRQGAPSAQAQQAAAIAVATVARHLGNPAAKVKSVVFQCANAAQETLYQDMIRVADLLKKRYVFELLLRPKIRRPTAQTAQQAFFDPAQLATFVPGSVNEGTNLMVLPDPFRVALRGTLNGIAFTPWSDAPTSAEGWNQLQEDLPEVPLAEPIQAVGVVITEADGRVWMVAPTNQRGGMINTFPGGVLGEAGLSLQGCARKQAYEKSGLQIRLIREFGDMKHDDTAVRYYLAERIGGTPAEAGWKSQAVHLVPRDQLADFLPDDQRHKRDRTVAEHLPEMPGQPVSPAPPAPEAAAPGSRTSSRRVRWADGQP